MLLIFQDKSADVFAEKIGEAVGTVVFIILVIAGIVWLFKKIRQK